MDFKRRKIASEAIVLNAARSGSLKKLKLFLNGKSKEEVSSLVSAQTDDTTPFIMACRNGHLDVAQYLVASCNVDIDQVGSITFYERIIYDIPPLWCAAAAGHFNIVKMLVKCNASVNSVAEDDSTALFTACSEGQFEIAKFLIQHGADIEIANKYGYTCLMTACFRGYYKISKYLLHCGADFNRKDAKGNTALHACAKSGYLNILKLLLQRGARSDCYINDSTLLLTAAGWGNSEVVYYFIHKIHCRKQDKINFLELLGSGILLRLCDKKKSVECWKRAMELRYEDGRSPLEKPIARSPIASCIDATEVRTLHQLEELVSDFDEMWTQALLVVERILGPDHPDIFSYIIICGDRYRNNVNFQRCLNLWMYELNVQVKFRDTLNDRTQTLLSCFVQLFSRMMPGFLSLDGGFSFQDILHVFKISLKKIKIDLCILTDQMYSDQMSYFYYTLNATIHLVGLICMMQTRLNIYENTEFKKAAYKLVHLNPKGRKGFTLLHLACCRDSSDFGNDRTSIIKFPSPEVVSLLLEVGACPNAVDASNNTPLHVAAMNMPCAPVVFKALVNHGAHLDLCNYERKTPFQLAEIMSFLDHNPMRYINLQCLSAKVIQKYKIPYEEVVPKNLKEFLDSH